MKFLALHLLTDPTSERERRSVADISQLACADIGYVPIINPVRTDPPPEWEKSREAPDRPFTLTPAHYGCYLAHRAALWQYGGDGDYDYNVPSSGLLMFECDSIFCLPLDQIKDRIYRAAEACDKHNLLTFTFGPKHNGRCVEDIPPDMMVTTQFIETHAYYIPLDSTREFRCVFAKPWDALDYVYTIYLYDQDKERIGTFKDRAVFAQADGTSLITGQEKTSEKHWRYKVYG